MGKLFSCNGFVTAADVSPFFYCAHTAIVDNAIAASNATTKPGFINGAAPMAAINGASKEGSIIATANESTANANRKPA
jgi:hypothetical protein